MSIFEYDQEKHMRFVKEEGFEEGYEKGRTEGREEGILHSIGIYINSLREYNVEDAKILDSLMKEFDISKEKAEAFMTKA